MKNYLILLCISTLLFSCGEKTVSREPVDRVKGDQSFIYVNTSDQRNIGSITLGEPMVVQAQNQRLTVRVKADKINFVNEKGETLYSARADQDGFKIKSGDRVVMKVKWNYDDKIKLADNEEMSNAYQIKINENDKIKIELGEELMKEYKMSYDTNNEWTADNYRFSGLGRSVASGIMFLPIGSDLEKMVAMAIVRREGK